MEYNWVNKAKRMLLLLLLANILLANLQPVLPRTGPGIDLYTEKVQGEEVD